jgi:hypothetical protein
VLFDIDEDCGGECCVVTVAMRGNECSSSSSSSSSSRETAQDLHRDLKSMQGHLSSHAVCADNRLNLGNATTKGLLLHGGFGFYEDCGGECCMETVAMRGNECSSSSRSSRETAQDLHRDLKSMQGHLSSHAVCVELTRTVNTHRI